MKKLMAVGMVLALITGSALGDASYTGTGDWSAVGNWTGGTGTNGLPGPADNVTLTGGADVSMSAASWQYFVDNSALTAGGSGEYRTGQFRAAASGTATVTFDFGNAHVYRATTASTYLIGSASGSHGTVTLDSGTVYLEGSKLYIGEKAGSTGALNISGGNFYAGRETGGVSMWVGTGGAGSITIDSGLFRTRAGLILGSQGTFSVLGSGVDTIGIGNYNSVDGNWLQNSGGTLVIGIDSGGVDQITINDKGGAGTFATFDAGALLDVSFLDGTQTGTWTIMEVENGAITDNGLALSAASQAAGWSFNIDNSGANGVLTVSIPEPATIGLIGMTAVSLMVVRRFRM